MLDTKWYWNPMSAILPYIWGL